MSTMAYQITGVSTVSSTVCSDAYQRKHQSSTSPAFVRSDRWIPRTKGPATRKMYPFDDGIMGWNYLSIPKLQRLHRWSLGMDKLFHPALYWACNYLSVIGLKLIHIIRNPWCFGVQYIPRNMHTVFALLCFVVVIHWLMFPYPSGLLHWHCGNLTIVPVPAKQPWCIWINTSLWTIA